MSEFDSAASTTSDQSANPDQLLNSIQQQFNEADTINDSASQQEGQTQQQEADLEETTEYEIQKLDHKTGEMVPTKLTASKIRSILHVPDNIDLTDPEMGKWLSKMTQGVLNMNTRAITAGKHQAAIQEAERTKEQGINMLVQDPINSVPTLLHSLGFSQDDIVAIAESILVPVYESRGLLAPDPNRPQQRQQQQYDPREDMLRQKEQELQQKETEQLAIQYEGAIERNISTALSNAGYQPDSDLISDVAREILTNRQLGITIGPKKAIENINSRIQRLSKSNPAAAAKNLPQSVTREATRQRVQTLKQQNSQVRLPNGQPAQQVQKITNPDDLLDSITNKFRS